MGKIYTFRIVKDSEGNDAIAFYSLFDRLVTDEDEIMKYLCSNQRVGNYLFSGDNQHPYVSDHNRGGDVFSAFSDAFASRYQTAVNTPDGQVAYYTSEPLRYYLKSIAKDHTVYTFYDNKGNKIKDAFTIAKYVANNDSEEWFSYRDDDQQFHIVEFSGVSQDDCAKIKENLDAFRETQDNTLGGEEHREELREESEEELRDEPEREPGEEFRDEPERESGEELSEEPEKELGEERGTTITTVPGVGLVNSDGTVVSADSDDFSMVKLPSFDVASASKDVLLKLIRKKYIDPGNAEAFGSFASSSDTLGNNIITACVDAKSKLEATNTEAFGNATNITYLDNLNEKIKGYSVLLGNLTKEIVETDISTYNETLKAKKLEARTKICRDEANKYNAMAPEDRIISSDSHAITCDSVPSTTEEIQNDDDTSWRTRYDGFEYSSVTKKWTGTQYDEVFHRINAPDTRNYDSLEAPLIAINSSMLGYTTAEADSNEYESYGGL